MCCPKVERQNYVDEKYDYSAVYGFYFFWNK